MFCSRTYLVLKRPLDRQVMEIKPSWLMEGKSFFELRIQTVS